MDKVKVSAPGKLMLFGEHSVVHNRLCIVTAVDQKIEVEASFNGENELIVNAPQLGISSYQRTVSELGNQEMPKQVSFIEAAVKQFYQKYGLEKGVNITTHSQFSHTYGFGSSSAITIATIKALSLLYKIRLSEKNLFDLGYQAVLEIQGVGSGFDLAAALWGGTLLYKKGAKVIEKLKIKNLPLTVCYSGVKADTPTLVRQVEEYKRKHPKKIKKIFDQMEEITLKAKNLLVLKKWPEIGQLMNENQKLLEELGVSTQILEKLIKAALGAGALGAKLSGAGGGDCIIALVDSKNKQKVEQALVASGGFLVSVATGVEGVRVESDAFVDDPEELFVVVDEKDKILGYKKRSQCHQDKSLIHRAVGVVIFNKKDKILLQKRSQQKDTNPGFYTISCSGHVSKGEGYKEATERELKEELGIKPPLEFFKKFITREEKETEMNVLFRAESEGPFLPNKEEIEKVGFFSKKEIRKLADKGKLTLFAKKSLQEMRVLK